MLKLVWNKQCEQLSLDNRCEERAICRTKLPYRKAAKHANHNRFISQKQTGISAKEICLHPFLFVISLLFRLHPTAFVSLGLVHLHSLSLPKPLNHLLFEQYFVGRYMLFYKPHHNLYAVFLYPFLPYRNA